MTLRENLPNCDLLGPDGATVVGTVILPEGISYTIERQEIDLETSPSRHFAVIASGGQLYRVLWKALRSATDPGGQAGP
jgi:hypothetical protein